MKPSLKTNKKKDEKFLSYYILRVLTIESGFLDPGHNGIAVFKSSEKTDYSKFHFYNAGGTTVFADSKTDDSGTPIYENGSENLIDLDPNQASPSNYQKTMMNYLNVTNEKIAFTDWEIPDDVAEKLIEIIDTHSLGNADYIDSPVPNCSIDCREMIKDAYIEAGYSTVNADKTAKQKIPYFLPYRNKVSDTDSRKMGALGSYRHVVNSDNQLDIIDGIDYFDGQGISTDDFRQLLID